MEKLRIGEKKQLIRQNLGKSRSKNRVLDLPK